jgi:hypothetical protein
LNGFQNLVCVSDLHKPLKQEPVSDFRADIAVFSRTIPFQKILALPSVILDLNGGHTSGAFVDWPYALKSTKVSRNFKPNQTVTSRRSAHFLVDLSPDTQQLRRVRSAAIIPRHIVSGRRRLASA